MRSDPIPLEEYEASVLEMVLAPQDARQGMNVVSIGSSALKHPFELATGVATEGGAKMYGARLDLSRLAAGPGSLQVQAMANTPLLADSYTGWLHIGTPRRWRARIAWSTGDTPSSSDILGTLGTFTGTVSCNGGLGPYGLLLTGVQHVTLSNLFSIRSNGCLRVGWRVLPDGMLAEAGVRYQGVQSELGALSRRLGMKSLTASVVGDPCKGRGSVSAVMDFPRATVAAHASTEGNGAPATLRAAIGFPLLATKSLLRCGWSFGKPGGSAKPEAEFGVLSSFRLAQTSCCLSMDFVGGVPTAGLQIQL